MQILINNDQNINRVCTKMSEGFSNRNKAKLSNCIKFKINESNETSDQTNAAYDDHMYASNDENDISLNNCQMIESEVRILKDWLVLHLDLIQQQNNEILDKEQTILNLKEENEMLKERIICMEKGTPFYPKKKNKIVPASEITQDNCSENMTQAAGICDEENKIVEITDTNCDNNSNNCSSKLIDFEENQQSDTGRKIDTNNLTLSPVDDLRITELKTEEFIINDISEEIKAESEVTDYNNSVTDYHFSLDDCSEFDPMKNLRMSIRRKRLCSNSSAMSNNDSTAEEKRSFRRFKKKRRRKLTNSFTKEAQILTTPDEYITQTGDFHVGISTETHNMEATTNLEVPRWRVKVYASCYTMEGTENLDDEVYNKRHSRLETDERRRKRWDVQRIREQRVIEKLKQRQERVGSGSRSDDQSEPLQSLWPKVDDIKYLEVSDELPVSAFGCPIPKLPPSEFTLPWLENPTILTKKVHTKRSTVKRKSMRR